MTTSAHLFVLGTSHTVASATIRERLYVDLDEVYRALRELRDVEGLVEEAIPLATCGRLELYCVSRRPTKAIARLRRLMARRTGLPREELARHGFLYFGSDAVLHLHRVAAGLDSVVHGEAQILGQVKDALNHPETAYTDGPVLHRLFQNAISAGKRVRSETKIGRGAASLASAALSLLHREVGDLSGLRVLVLGAGDTGSLMGHLLYKAGARRTVVANRTLDRARELADALGGEAAPLSDFRRLMARADLVVGAVTASDYLVTPATPPLLDGEAAPWPRYFLDLAHPRNFHPDLEEMEGVRVFDLEHVFRKVEEARESRSRQVPEAERIVEEEAQEYMAWLRARGGVPVLKAVRARILAVAEAEAMRHSHGMTDREREHLRRFARALAKRLLHEPTVALRAADLSSDGGRALLEHAAMLFGVEDAPLPEEEGRTAPTREAS
ncbi:MAG: glutamyl-tRNA reductase [Gemmatimonadota bacterium]